MISHSLQKTRSEVVAYLYASPKTVGINTTVYNCPAAKDRIMMPERLTLLVSCALLSAQPVSYAQERSSWQTGAEVKVHLSVRNKLAEKPYTVQFVVFSGGKKYTATKTTKMDDSGLPEWIKVAFPDDFAPFSNLTDGQYKWQALVAGKPVATGSFVAKNGSTAPQVTLDQLP